MGGEERGVVTSVRPSGGGGIWRGGAVEERER